jgi:hypothetical protein
MVRAPNKYARLYLFDVVSNEKSIKCFRIAEYNTVNRQTLDCLPLKRVCLNCESVQLWHLLPLMTVVSKRLCALDRSGDLSRSWCFPKLKPRVSFEVKVSVIQKIKFLFLIMDCKSTVRFLASASILRRHIGCLALESPVQWVAVPDLSHLLLV